MYSDEATFQKKNPRPWQELCHNILLGYTFSQIVNSLGCGAQSNENDRIYHN